MDSITYTVTDVVFSGKPGALRVKAHGEWTPDSGLPMSREIQLSLDTMVGFAVSRKTSRTRNVQQIYSIELLFPALRVLLSGIHRVEGVEWLEGNQVLDS